MRKIVKQSVGIDISKNSFTACICSLNENGENSFVSPKEFINDKKGFEQFFKWVNKNSSGEAPIKYVMEATGVYHEFLAVYLHKNKSIVSVVLANRVKYYAKALNVKTKTDSVDSRTIARMGVEHQIDTWQPPVDAYIQLRSLTRHLDDLKIQKQASQNHLEALDHSEFDSKFVRKSYEQIIKTMEKQIVLCESQIQKIVECDTELADRIRKLVTIKGVGFITAVSIVAETQGFALFTSRKQLASYAGLDVVERQSGSSVKGKTRISKKGNKRLRKALYFPAIVASLWNPIFKEDYNRIIETKKSKKIGIIAIQRKMLLLIYTLWKNGQEFSPQLITSGN